MKGFSDKDKDFLKRAHGYYPEIGIGELDYTVFVGDTKTARRLRRIVDDYVDRYKNGERGSIIELLNTCPTLIYFIHKERYANLKRALFELFDKGEVRYRKPSEKKKETLLQDYVKQRDDFYRSLGLSEDERNDLILEDSRFILRSYFEEKVKNDPTKSFSEVSKERVRQARKRAKEKEIDDREKLVCKIKKFEKKYSPSSSELLVELTRTFIELAYARARLRKKGRLRKYKKIKLPPDEDTVIKLVMKKWPVTDKREAKKLFKQLQAS